MLLVASSFFVAYIFLSPLLCGHVNCVKVEDFTTIEVDNFGISLSCLYVSNDPIWPYKYGDFDVNYAENNCKELGMKLADQISPLEGVALQELTSRRHIIFSSILIFFTSPKSKGPTSSNSYF